MNNTTRRYFPFLLCLAILGGCVTTSEQIEEFSQISEPQQNEVIAEVNTQNSQEVDVLEISEPEKTPQQLEDVWQRIRAQLSFEHSDHPRVTRRINWYLNHPNYMHTISNRAAPFLYYLVNEVEKRQLPIELAMLPLIESDFNTEAYSHKHASGLWQLTPYIAKHFGVQINAWYDGRQDIVESTQASLDFLEYLYERFDGNWYHTIAAYNTGEGRVFRAIRSNKRLNKSTDFFSLKLPKETRHFVPKLLAVSQILKNEMMEFPAIQNEPVISVIPLARRGVLPDSGNWKDVDKLNPGYVRFPALLEGPEHIVIPMTREAEWHQLMDTFPELEADTWLQYSIRSGDTLSGIASRYSLTVDQIKSFNQLTTSRIRAGKTLLLPLLADEQINYTVKAGDSLWHIAKRFGISISKLKQWNQLSSDILQIGETLSIFVNNS